MGVVGRNYVNLQRLEGCGTQQPRGKPCGRVVDVQLLAVSHVM
jgi:hypothetical protein